MLSLLLFVAFASCTNCILPYKTISAARQKKLNLTRSEPKQTHCHTQKTKKNTNNNATQSAATATETVTKAPKTIQIQIESETPGKNQMETRNLHRNEFARVCRFMAGLFWIRCLGMRKGKSVKIIGFVPEKIN